MNLQALFRPEEVPLAGRLLVRWLGLEDKEPGSTHADLEALLVLAAFLRPRSLPEPEAHEASVGARLLSLLLPLWVKDPRAGSLAREVLAAGATLEVLGEGGVLAELWREAKGLLEKK